MGRHAAQRKRRPRILASLILAAALVPATGTGAAPDPARTDPVAQARITAPDATLTFERPQVTTVAGPPPFRGMSLAAFLATYEGTSTVLPGYSTAECMAVFSAYHYSAVLGRPYSSPGAKDLWPQAWDEYDKIPATEPARRGDVVTWAGDHGAYLGGGNGHVAIVIADHGNSLAAFGQNPNPATTLELSKSGVLGYLRPKHLNP